MAEKYRKQSKARIRLRLRKPTKNLLKASRESIIDFEQQLLTASRFRLKFSVCVYRSLFACLSLFTSKLSKMIDVSDVFLRTENEIFDES